MKPDKNHDFRQFKMKMLFRTIGMAVLAILCIWALYSFFLYGKFADWMVGMIEKLFRIDYVVALDIYQQTFRNRMDLIILAATMIVFFVIFRIYLNRFTNYFEEIDRGMDNLVREDAGEISLSPELLPLERKMNAVRHTAEKQQKDMLAAEQRKNDLVMYLAHDLKTPLASVIGYLDLLNEEKGISEELREKYLSISLDKAQRLDDLIQEFFEIAKFNLSNITLQYSRINLTRLLEMLLYEFGPMLKEKELTCRFRAGQDIMLKCDGDKIQRVFDNLLRNAVIYSFPRTDIDITAAEEDGNMVIRFANHGDTIPKEKLERIFEQFYRLDTSRSTGGGGAGLGLAIAKQIVELHGGTITAASENEVTEFVVLLPIS